MARLRGPFGEMGLEGVDSFLARGNVVFDAPGEELPDLEARIEAHLEEGLGYPVATFLRPLERLAELADHEVVPAAREEGSIPRAIFLRREPDDGVAAALEALYGGPYVSGFEASSFSPCAAEYEGEQWWLEGEDAAMWAQLSERIQQLRPDTAGAWIYREGPGGEDRQLRDGRE